MDPKRQQHIERRERLLDAMRNLLVEDLRVRHRQVDIDPETPLFGTGLGLDSVDAIELVVAVESRFGITMPDAKESRRHLRTVNTLLQYVLDRTTERDEVRP